MNAELDLTTVEIPTPATDAYAALSEERASARDLFIEDAKKRFSALPKEEAIAKALEQNSWLQKSKVATKDKAVNILARDAWDASEQNKANEAMREESRAERRLIEKIREAQAVVDSRIERRAKSLADWPHDTRSHLDAEFEVHEAERTWGHWYSLAATVVREGLPVAEAAKTLADRVQQELLSTHRQRALSRSTSVLTNLIDDVDNEADAAWLGTVRNILRGW